MAHDLLAAELLLPVRDLRILEIYSGPDRAACPGPLP